MSDYLGHLLERSFTPVPEVRPQVPSLFEPKPAGEAAEISRESSAKIQPIAEENHHRYSAIDRQQKSVPRPPSSDIRAESASASKKQSEAQNLSRQIPAPIDLASENQRDVRSRSGPIAAPVLSNHPSSSSVETPGNPPLLRKEVSQPVASETPPTASSIKPSPSPVVVDFHIDDPPRRPGDRRPPASTQLAQALQPHARPVVPDNAQPPRALVPRSVPSSTSAPSREKIDRRNDSPVPAAPAIPHSINVSIGRVEIRATPPPAPVVRPTPRKESGMSLETYLQRRSGVSS